MYIFTICIDPKIDFFDAEVRRFARSVEGGSLQDLTLSANVALFFWSNIWTMVMQQNLLIFACSTRLHQRNFEIGPSILVGSERSLTIGVGPDAPRSVKIVSVVSWCTIIFDA